MVNFEFDHKAKPHEQANQILQAVSDSQIAPDIGQMFIGSIKSMIKNSIMDGYNPEFVVNNNMYLSCSKCHIVSAFYMRYTTSDFSCISCS